MAIQSVGINPDRGKRLEKKAVELIIKSKKNLKESEIVNFLIDELLDRVDIDNNGLFITDDEQFVESEVSTTVKQKIAKSRK
jgi:hypothetical protein